MEYLSVAKMAEKWGLSERSVQNYCAQGRIRDSKLIGKTKTSVVVNPNKEDLITFGEHDQIVVISEN